MMWASLQARGSAKRSPATTRARRAQSSATARRRSHGAAFRRWPRWRSAAGRLGNWREPAPVAARRLIPRKRRLRRPSGLSRTSLEIRLDRALELDRHRLAEAVAAAAGGDADPAFRNAIFDDVGLFLPVELDADAAGQQRFVDNARCADRARGGRAGCRVRLSAMRRALASGALASVNAPISM